MSNYEPPDLTYDKNEEIKVKSYLDSTPPPKPKVLTPEEKEKLAKEEEEERKIKI